MPGNRRKNTPQKPVEPVAEPLAARVVAIPKDPLPAANAAPRLKPETAKAERIGDTLRKARTDKNDDLYLIAEYLCIKPAFLIALENSRYDEFPADAYVIGFLRTYANFLGVDGKEAVDRYRYEMAGRRKKPVLSMPTPVSEGRAPTGIVMAGATIVILLIYALWYGLSSSNRAEVNVPPPLPTTAQPVPALSSDAAPPGAAGLTAPVASTAAPTPSGIPPAAPGIVVAGPAAPATAAMAAETPPVPDKKDVAIKDTEPKDASKETKTVYGDANTVSRLIIRATQSSWIMITDDSGKAVFDHVLKPGETYKVPNKPGLSLTTGNGSGIELLLDGNPLPKVAGGAPHVVRNIPLDPDRLTAAPSAPEHN